MQETINVCQHQNDKLKVIKEVKLTTKLDENLMELFVKYNGQRYQVQGQYNFAYIVVDGE